MCTRHATATSLPNSKLMLAIIQLIFFGTQPEQFFCNENFFLRPYRNRMLQALRRFGFLEV